MRNVSNANNAQANGTTDVDLPKNLLYVCASI